MSVIHEDEVEETKLPGRFIKWVVTKDRLGAKHLSVCMIRVPIGETVKPAHCHPNGEEVIYIIRGHGRVWIDGKIDDVREGSLALFPQGSVHMLQNTGDKEMKAICFFAPPSNIETYKFFEDITFPL